MARQGLLYRWPLHTRLKLKQIAAAHRVGESAVTQVSGRVAEQMRRNASTREPIETIKKALAASGAQVHPLLFRSFPGKCRRLLTEAVEGGLSISMRRMDGWYTRQRRR